MADNFNLRQFLTENKLTKNAKLLAEEINPIVEDIAGAFHDAGITGTVTLAFHSEHGMGEPEITVMSAEKALQLITRKAGKAEDVIIAQGDEIDQQGDYEEETKGLECKLEVAILDHGTYEVYQGSNSLNEGSDYGYEAVVDAIADHFDEGSYEYDQVLKAVEDKFHSNQIDTSDFSHDPSAPSRIVSDIADELGLGEYENDEPSAGGYVSRRDIEETVEEAKSYKTSSNSKEAQHLKKGDIIGSGDEVVSVSAGAKTPSGKVEVTLKTKDGKTKTSTWGKTTKVGVKPKETVKESKQSPREKYLTRLVENALGLEVTEDDNVDYTMGRHDDPDQLPNPPAQLNIPEGEEMVAEKPLPKYENIEKLMQEIEHGTNEAAYKHKKNKMKEVAEMLETRVAALEEGEGAEFIDTKKVKQMKKDIMTLRKQAEKLEKEYDKKFGEKKARKEQE